MICIDLWAQSWLGERNFVCRRKHHQWRYHSPRGEKSLFCARQKKWFRAERRTAREPLYARGGECSFFFAGNANGRRGWAAAVALTRVAQLGNRGEQTSRRRRWGRRRRRRDREEHSRAHGYLYIFCFFNLHVSPRVSSLFRAQHSCGVAVSLAPLHSPLSRFFGFFSHFSSYVSLPRWPANKRIILSSPIAVKIQNIPLCDGRISWRKIRVEWRRRSFFCLWQFIYRKQSIFI